MMGLIHLASGRQVMMIFNRKRKRCNMWRANFVKLSAQDVAYCVDMASACLITDWVMAFLLPHFVAWRSEPVGVLWAVISTVFVYKDTRAHSLSAGVSRLIATFSSFVLCLIYLLMLPATAIGIAALIAIGTLFMILIGRREEMGLTAITIAVVMIVAASNPHDALQQPLLRLIDTIVGIAVGVSCKWVNSFVFYRIIGKEAR
jgi:Fusaric acid resistance protein-like